MFQIKGIFKLSLCDQRVSDKFTNISWYLKAVFPSENIRVKYENKNNIKKYIYKLQLIGVINAQENLNLNFLIEWKNLSFLLII